MSGLIASESGHFAPRDIWSTQHSIFGRETARLCGLLPLERQLLDLSVIFHCHSKMASCAARETPAYGALPTI